jgi:hypothetical protein
MGSFVGTESDGRLFSEGNELKLMLCTETGFLGEKDEETWGTGTQPLRESNPEPFPLKSRTHGDRSTSGLKAISLVSPSLNLTQMIIELIFIIATTLPPTRKEKKRSSLRIFVKYFNHFSRFNQSSHFVLIIIIMLVILIILSNLN